MFVLSSICPSFLLLSLFLPLSITRRLPHMSLVLLQVSCHSCLVGLLGSSAYQML